MSSERDDVAGALLRLAYPVFQKRYYLDPAGFATDCINYPRGEGPTDYQLESLDELVKYGRLAERGPHGLGKTFRSALVVHWFALTRDGKDWKVPTTASVWRQLTKFLWPEIHKVSRWIRWDVVGRPRYIDNKELKKFELELTTGAAFAVASNQPSALEGTHADHICYVYDEAKSIPDETFDATEGAFATASKDDDPFVREAYALIQSTPGAPAGRFFSIHARRPGFEDWHVRHVTLEQAITNGRVSQAWADQRKKQWGETSPIYKTRVEGEFATAEDGVIPLAWVEAAVDRWLELPRDEQDRIIVDERFRCVPGCDIADGGGAENVIAERWGPVVRGLETFGGVDLMDTTGRVSNAVERTLHGLPVVDVIGVGSGVVSRLRELGLEVLAFHAGQRTEFRDRSGELRFANKRAGAWWNMRELLDPKQGIGVCLPDDEMLISDLTTPRYRMQSGGAIVIQSKDEIAELIGRSTDRGDAVVMSFFADVLLFVDSEPVHGVMVYEEPVTISPV